MQTKIEKKMAMIQEYMNETIALIDVVAAKAAVQVFYKT